MKKCENKLRANQKAEESIAKIARLKEELKCFQTEREI